MKKIIILTIFLFIFSSCTKKESITFSYEKWNIVCSEEKIVFEKECVSFNKWSILIPQAHAAMDWYMNPVNPLVQFLQ